MRPFPLLPGTYILPQRRAKAAQLCAFLGIAALCLPLALALVGSQFFHTNALRFGGFGLAQMMDGTAARPFVFRVMTGWLVRLALALHVPSLSLPYLDGIVSQSCPAIAAHTGTACGAVKAYAAVASVSAWGFLLAMYCAACQVVGGVIWGTVAVAFAALTVNAVLLQGFGQIYDFPVLLMSTVLFILAVNQRDAVFLPAFAVGCLVKESLLLSAVVYACIAVRRRSSRRVAVNATLHVITFTLIYGWERQHFAANIGQPVYSFWDSQLRFLLDTANVRDVILLLALCALLLYGLRRKHIALRRAMMVLPALAGLYFAFGNPGEYRIVFDVFPVVLLPVIDTLRRIVSSA